jgi:Ser/Thr protein kinase RdoA (MazF antagonist)
MFYQVGENAWRIMLAAAFVPAVPLLVMVWWIPESPRWLMKKDRYQKAFRSFCRLRKAEIQAARDMVRFFFLVMGCADDSSTPIVRSLRRRMHSRERITLLDSEISSPSHDSGGLI